MSPTPRKTAAKKTVAKKTPTKKTAEPALRCAVCSHPHRGRISQALATGMQTPVGVAAIYSLTPRDVFAHIETCGADVLDDDPAVGPIVTGRSIQRGILVLLADLLDDFENSDKIYARAKVASEIRMNFELLARMTGNLAPDGQVQVNVDASTGGVSAVIGSEQWEELCRIYNSQPAGTAEERLELAAQAAELWPLEPGSST